MSRSLQEIKDEVAQKIAEAVDVETLDAIRISVLGKKGELTQILKGMKDLSPEERPKVGQQVNEVRKVLEDKIAEQMASLKDKLLQDKMKRETIDVTLPGTRAIRGHKHPNQVAREALEKVFIGMGYEIVDGPEVEYDKYNFEMLNIPANHPAKDEQDTFYIKRNPEDTENDILLRTQTSSVQARIMEGGKLPIKILSPGRVFRADSLA